ncbi:type II toxin-antitoxin system RelE/ParE family toxin [Flavobacterium sp. LaA7.5]|nr:type II toxin-antitoxin system RelE/ParE family toxin [Flavobacterium salilacus subsp. altitudinum]
MKVVFSNLAYRKLEQVSEYLEEEWSEKVKKKFIATLKEKIEQISSFPESCIKSDFHDNLRMCIITKQTSLLYRINDNEIEVITLFDNRTNFKKITTEIRKHYGRI